MRIVDIHSDLIGKICKITSLGVLLEEEYEKLFHIGSSYVAQRLYDYCYSKNQYEISLIFIDEKPITIYGITRFCVKEIGKEVNGDYYWFTLNQLMLCDE